MCLYRWEDPLKQWMQKLLEQFDVDWGTKSHTPTKKTVDISEDRATLLYVIDTYNKYLFEIDKQPTRKVREALDTFSKQLVNPETSGSSDVLFKLRQFFSSYRIDESVYVNKTFDDFKRIIWDFADQLGEDLQFEQTKDAEARKTLEGLREAVESDSINDLKAKSREFINFYIDYQSTKDARKTKRMDTVKKNLSTVKKQLMEANQTMRVDHLTNAYNRKSFEEQMAKYIRIHELSRSPVSLIMLDIDFFKKINDSYGHDIGDFVLKECVHLLKEVFNRDVDFVARLGGEEFGVLLPEMTADDARKKADEAMTRIRKEVFVHGNLDIRFTVSMGIAELEDSEAAHSWLKRADESLYEAKNSGRNKYVISNMSLLKKVS